MVFSPTFLQVRGYWSGDVCPVRTLHQHPDSGLLPAGLYFAAALLPQTLHANHRPRGRYALTKVQVHPSRGDPNDGLFMMYLLVYLTSIRKEKKLSRTELPHSNDEEEELIVNNEDSEDEGKPPRSLLFFPLLNQQLYLCLPLSFSGAHAQ